MVSAVRSQHGYGRYNTYNTAYVYSTLLTVMRMRSIEPQLAAHPMLCRDDRLEKGRWFGVSIVRVAASSHENRGEEPGPRGRVAHAPSPGRPSGTTVPLLRGIIASFLAHTLFDFYQPSALLRQCIVPYLSRSSPVGTLYCTVGRQATAVPVGATPVPGCLFATLMPGLAPRMESPTRERRRDTRGESPGQSTRDRPR